MISLPAANAAKDWMRDLKTLRRRGEEKGFDPPSFLILVKNPTEASQTYVRNKMKKCQELGIWAEIKDYTNVPTDEIVHEVVTFQRKWDGIMFQLPFGINPKEFQILRKIVDETQDVDGCRPRMLGQIVEGTNFLLPCTPKGILYLLDYNLYSVRGANCLIINRSEIVGLPLAQLLTRRNATVTIAHSQTYNLKEYLKRADYIFTATGKPHLFDASDLKDRALVVDIGCSNLDGKWVGDFDPKNEPASSTVTYTPVPGGVGPMTVMALMSNIIQAWWFHNTNKVIDQHYGVWRGSE